MKKRGLRSNLIALYSFLRRGWREEMLVSSSWYPVMGDVGIVQGKFTLGFRKHFFTKRLIKKISLPRGMLDAPGLSVFKTHLDRALNTVL